MHNEQTWMEPVLARHLGRVEAPAELWDRIECPRVPRVHARVNATRMSACAALAAAIVIAALLWGSHARINTPDALQFHSNNPAQVRAWVKTNTGLDVPLHAGALVGASLVEGKTAAAEIAYRVGSQDVVVRVSNAGFPASGPRTKTARVSSWTAHGQTYTLACSAPQDLKLACLLCHAGA